MSDFYIVPPRLIVGSLQRSNVVTSLNTLRGDLSFKVNPDSGLTLNINSGVFTFSITPDFYIKKSGDIVPSNIIFQPDPGKYGLAVGSGPSDPGTGVSGALYFNTTYSVLKVYDGSTWNEIASTGTSGITQSFADNRYLRLDGGNNPTGAISMGSQFLRFANLTTRVASGTAGQVYYNTDTNKLDLYNGSSWVAVGSGITSITAGSGISLSSNPITSYGSVSINEAYNFNWTGTQTYSQPITFSTSQTFDASKLTIPYEVQGDILHFDGASWARLPLGTPNQVLSVSNCGADVEWHSLVAGPGIAITYDAGSLVFYTRPAQTPTAERMRITSSGSLLIGTTVQAVNTAGTASITNFKGINAYEFNNTTGRGSTQGISWNYLINTTHIIDISPGDTIIAFIDVRLAAYSSSGSGYANSLFCYGGHVGAYNITTVFNVINGNVSVSAAIVSSKLRITITIANSGLGGECVLTVTDANKNGTLSTVVRS
jgi:hypothetical protein